MCKFNNIVETNLIKVEYTFSFIEFQSTAICVEMGL